MLTHLALCHSIIVDEKTGKYNASSPDELALVNAAKFFGYQFMAKDENGVISIRVHGKERRYKLLNTLEFNSTRKRMSVVIEDLQSPSSSYGHNDIYVLTKGADSII
jgi:phospholipid-transporting ATPase